MIRLFLLTATASLALAACDNKADPSANGSSVATDAGSLASTDSLPTPEAMANAALPTESGEAFLDALAQQPNAEKQDNGSVIMTLEAGTGVTPGENDLVKVHFIARVAGQSDTFGSSYDDGSPVVFALNEAMPGWSATLQSMKEGGMARVALPASLAFGEAGMGDQVPPNAVTVYDFELLKVYSASDDEALTALTEELQASIDSYSRRAQVQQGLAQQQMSGLAAASSARSALFVATQAEREETQTTESGLVYEVVTDVEDGPTPAIGDMITVNYRGTLPNGDVFDSSYDRGQPATFELGRVIEGWNEALQLMNPGDVYRLYIPSDLAYGARGTPGGSIGPNQALIFDVELLEIEPAPAPDEPADE